MKVFGQGPPRVPRPRSVNRVPVVYLWHVYQFSIRFIRVDLSVRRAFVSDVAIAFERPLITVVISGNYRYYFYRFIGGKQAPHIYHNIAYTVPTYIVVLSCVDGRYRRLVSKLSLSRSLTPFGPITIIYIKNIYIAFPKRLFDSAKEKCHSPRAVSPFSLASRYLYCNVLSIRLTLCRPQINRWSLPHHCRCHQETPKTKYSARVL